MIVAYYTTDYAAEAARLKTSMEALGLPFYTRDVGRRISWLAACHIRPAFLTVMLEQYGDILSLDADCIVHSDPMPYMRKLECDVAVHYLSGHEPLPGTMWLCPGPASEFFLEIWASLDRVHADRPDRINCAGALEIAAVQAGLRIARLPPEYAFIFDTSRDLHPGTEPVIEHLQASRELRLPAAGPKKLIESRRRYLAALDRRAAS
ncbi:MAG TPA: hypothetical protein VMW52_04600 [Phycisphaerae bacterium]|nr:hypothetical protein [Phycisphaerae bacterium]